MYVIIDSGAVLINIGSSLLTNTHVGESAKLIDALFSLARKLAPSIILIDEIDKLLRCRDCGNKNQYQSQIHGAFAHEWDGLGSRSLPVNSRVIIIGTAIHPNNIDEVFLRRLSYSIEVALPSNEDRLAILMKLLPKQTSPQEVDLVAIAEVTTGYSGFDLRELLRLARLQYIKKRALKPFSLVADAIFTRPRPLTQEDFTTALRVKQISTESFEHYRW